MSLNTKNTLTDKQLCSLTCFFLFACLDKYESIYSLSSGKNLKSVFDFLTYSREMGFSFSYAEVVALHRPNVASNEINRVSKFDNSLSFGAKQSSLRQIFFEL